VNVNTMGAKGYTVMTVMMIKITIWNIVETVMRRTALSADTWSAAKMWLVLAVYASKSFQEN